MDLRTAREELNREEPLVLARRHKDGFGLEILCPFCNRMHQHSWGLGPRYAHCPGPPTTRQYLLVAGDDETAKANTAALILRGEI